MDINNNNEVNPLFLAWYITRNCDKILISSDDTQVIAEDIENKEGA